MTIGERIKKLRTEKMGMSQVAFADSIEVSKQTLYKYENNIITNIPSDKIEAIAKLCKVSPAYLMGWNNDAETSNVHNTEDVFVPETTVERKFVALFRAMGDETEEEKKNFEQYFETTIDMFLTKKGIILEDDE